MAASQSAAESARRIRPFLYGQRILDRRCVPASARLVAGRKRCAAPNLWVALSSFIFGEIGPDAPSAEDLPAANMRDGRFRSQLLSARWTEGYFQLRAAIQFGRQCNQWSFGIAYRWLIPLGRVGRTNEDSSSAHTVCRSVAKLAWTRVFCVRGGSARRKARQRIGTGFIAYRSGASHGYEFPEGTG